MVEVQATPFLSDHSINCSIIVLDHGKAHYPVMQKQRYGMYARKACMPKVLLDSVPAL